MPARVRALSPRSGQGPRRRRFQPICGTGSPRRRAPRPRGRRRGVSPAPRGRGPRLPGRPAPRAPSPPSRGREALHRLAPRTGPYRPRPMSLPAPGAGCRRGHGEALRRVPAPLKRLPRPRLCRRTSRLPRGGPRPFETRETAPGGQGFRWDPRADATTRRKPRQGSRGTSPGRAWRPGAGCLDPPKPEAPPSASAGS
jgi:hypothetical protein